MSSERCNAEWADVPPRESLSQLPRGGCFATRKEKQQDHATALGLWRQ